MPEIDLLKVGWLTSAVGAIVKTDCVTVLVLVMAALLKSAGALDVYVKFAPFKSKELEESGSVIFPLTVIATLGVNVSVPAVTARLERLTVFAPSVSVPVPDLVKLALEMFPESV